VGDILDFIHSTGVMHLEWRAVVMLGVASLLLWLAIVKQLVEAAGGRVGAESSGGQTRFWFSLPG